MLGTFLARSLLYTPATRPDRFAKALSSGSDIVAVDLEDSISPGDKAVARQNVLAWLKEPGGGRVARAVRVNSTRTVHGLQDILAMLEAQAGPDLIVLPKARGRSRSRAAGGPPTGAACRGPVHRPD
jgi:(S)-citramalyl-CoA lyase